MLQIRQGVFETNSSSTHSITMCSQDEFKAWVDGRLYLNEGCWKRSSDNPAKEETFITKDEAISLITDDVCSRGYESLEAYYDKRELSEERAFHEFGIYSVDDYPTNESLEYFEEGYTTPSGETVIVFGEYGYDY